jgi:single-stranded-DNA-specific exonuclease
MRWILPSSDPQAVRISEVVGGDTLLAQLLWARGLRSVEEARAFLDPDSYSPASPYELPGMAEAVGIVAGSIQQGEKIGVWGDFDVDGQTATTLLVSALAQLEADVEFHIPIRATESHGIKVPNLAEFLTKEIDLLLTCDTGISEHEGIAYARQQGVKVVITDHHDLPDELPVADAIINPKFLPADHPLGQLPGVGAAYKFIEALFSEFGRQDRVSQFLDLVALGIIADVAVLRGDTRYLLQRGLNVLRSTGRLGLQMMCELAGIEQFMITEEDIGFGIAPRLNALGRLGDANQIVEFLTTTDESIAAVTAHQLEGMNAERKVQTNHVYRAVVEKVEGQPQFSQAASIVVAGERWPGGVIGLAAGRLSTKYNKPSIVLTKKEDNTLAGSARSVEGVDISAAVRACGNLLISYGGHPMAAGLSLDAENLPAFRRKLDRAILVQTGGEIPEPELSIDHILGLSEVDLDLAFALARLSPYGPGNPRPVLGAQDLKVVSHSGLGRNGDHRQIIVEDRDGNRQKILWWRGAEEDLPSGHFDLAFTAGINRFRGEASLQLTLVDLRLQESLLQTSSPDTSELEVVDLRQVENPEDRLRQIVEGSSGVMIWGEGLAELPGKAVNRFELSRSDILVIWSTPPSFPVCREVVAAVDPARVIVVGKPSGVTGTREFLQQLAGLLKFVAAKRDGRVGAQELASRLALTDELIELGIRWIQAKGKIRAEERAKGDFTITMGGTETHGAAEAAKLELEISRAWKELAAFREYFQSTGIEELKGLLIN